jgi:hypothetical protein
MFSFLGWTPALRRMLRGRVLSCGCTAGVYETWSGAVVHLIDVRSNGCAVTTHIVDAVVDDKDAAGRAAPEVASV